MGMQTGGHSPQPSMGASESAHNRKVLLPAAGPLVVLGTLVPAHTALRWAASLLLALPGEGLPDSAGLGLA